MKIEIEGFAEEHFLEALTREVHNRASDLIDKAIREGIQPALEEALSTLAVEVLRPAVVAVLEEGWQPTDGYGNPKGDRMDIKGIIRDSLVGKKNTYEESAAERIANEVVRTEYKRDIDGEIAKLRDGFRKQVDEALQVKFRDAMAEALGIKRG
jgi:hypothetical protein